jgi:hypothetical protein
MAKNTNKGYRKGTVADRTQVKNPRTGLWTKRDGSTGQFTAVKKDAGSFKGVKRER